MSVRDDYQELELWLNDDDCDADAISDWEAYKKRVLHARDLGFLPVHPADRTVNVPRTANLTKYLG